MSMVMHVCLSVRGALKWPKSRLRMLASDENGKWLGAEETREFLMDHLSQGHEVIPLGKGCEGFDWKTGCPGHEKPEPTP